MLRRLAVLTLLLPASAIAQGAPGLTLSGAMEETLSNHPTLQVAAEAVPQAAAQNTQALAYITPRVNVGLNHRVNDREIAFDTSDSFGFLNDAFGGIYGNLGHIYTELFTAGMIDASECDAIAATNGFDDCESLTDAFVNGNIGGDASGGSDTEPTVIQPKEQTSVAAQLNWPIDPRVATTLAAGTANVRAAEHDLRKVRSDVLLAVVRTYAAAYRMQETTSILQEQTVLAEKHLANSETLLKAGVVTPDVVLQARLQIERARGNLRINQQQERDMRRTLAFAMGRRGSIDTPLAPLPATRLDPGRDVQAWVERGLDTRPDGLAAREQMMAAAAQAVDSALAFLPQFSLSGQFSWTAQVAGFDEQRTAWWVGLGVNLPVWDGGINVTRARTAASRKRQAEAQVRAVGAQVALDVANAYDAWLTAQGVVPVSELALSLAEEAHRMVEVRFSAGSARAIEVDDARSSLEQARLDLLGNQIDLDLAAAELLAAAGELRVGSFSD